MPPGGRQECDRVVHSLGNRLGLANLFGAIAIAAYGEATLGPSPGQQVHVARDLLVLALFLAVAFPACGVWQYRSLRRVLAWYRDGRRPTPEERDRTLAQPWRKATGPFVCWLSAAAYYLAIDLLFTHPHHTVAHDLRLTDAILLGGVATCALTYLLFEQAFRPVIAAALHGEAGDGHRKAIGIRHRLLLAWAVSSGIPLLGLAVAPQTHEPGASLGLGPSVVILAVIGLLAGELATASVAKSLAHPIDEVRRALGRVQDGDLDVVLEVDDGGEIGQLQAGFNHMVADLRERRRLRDLFGRHVGTEVAARALVSGTGLGGEHREASVLFVDLVGSTALAEVLAPDEVVGTLNAFFAAVVDVVAAEGGWVNKFEGDGALCVFGAPSTQPDHAARALRAARALHARVDALAVHQPAVDAAIGVSSGPLVAGNVGTEQRYEYTVIGRPVNEAARLTDLAKGRDGRVLASEGALARAGDEADHWADLGTVALRGQAAPAAIFEPAPGVRAPTRSP